MSTTSTPASQLAAPTASARARADLRTKALSCVASAASDAINRSTTPPSPTRHRIDWPTRVPAHPPIAPGQVLRHFTVAVFVVHKQEVLLHFHRKLGKWLPPGGHIEDGELPDDAAVREVLEETGVRGRLVGSHGLLIDEPRQLVLPAGVQLETIYPGHEHIDLVYFGVPDPNEARSAEVDPRLARQDRVGPPGTRRNLDRLLTAHDLSQRLYYKSTPGRPALAAL
jgi:8-oxo-dGTP pyrophosphatase MutT (NUDIX family)